MGAKLSKHRHAHRAPTPTLEQDAAIGGTGGAVTGLVSGVGFVFVNALGVRASMTILGLCAVGGAVVGALVCVAGTVVVKSLAWLYRQLRKRARRGVEIQLQVMQQQRQQRQRQRGGATTTTAITTPPTAMPMATAVPVAAQQAALAQARVERARAMEELAEYDRLLAEAEAQLQQALSSSSGSSSASSVVTAMEGQLPLDDDNDNKEEDVDEVEQQQAQVAPVTAVPPPQFFHPAPLHITLRLRDLEDDGSEVEGTDASEEEATDDDEFCLVDRLEEGQQQLVRRALAVGGSGAGGGRPPRVGTPPIY